jgi:hypothetical protein
MVTMAAKRPIVTMNHGSVAAGERPIRTALTLPRPRLTRRGRMAVTGVSALLIGALSVGLATAAQATRSGSASPGRYLSKVMVLPGQSLWSLAEAYDPDADTRQVVQQIK